MSNVSQFFGGGVKSIQRGVISIDTGSTSTGTATITAVDTSKSMIVPLGATGASFNTAVASRLALTNSTTVTAVARNGSGVSSQVIDVGYQVIEFN